MKTAYPVLFTPSEGGYVATVPDFNIDTQGDTLADAIEMARDAIGIMGIDMEDDKIPLPPPSKTDKIPLAEGEVLSMVDIDFTAYRKSVEKRTVRRNVSLPCWLNTAAEKAGINFSAVLQSALKKELHMDTP